MALKLSHQLFNWLSERLSKRLSKRSVVTALVSGLSLSFIAPAQAQQIDPTFKNSEEQVGGPIPEVNLTRQLMYQILAAEIAAQRGQTSVAARTYSDGARETRDPRLAQRATELALASRALDRALAAAQLWYELAPGSTSAAQTVEALWLGSGKLADAEPLLAKRLAQARKEKNVAATYQQLMRLLPGMTDKKAALSMFERISKEDQNVPEARLAMAQVASQAGANDRAVLEARAAVKLAPDRAEIAIAAARVLGDSPNGVDEAIGLLQEATRRQPKAVEAYFALGRLQLQKGQVGPAQQTFENALKQEPQSPTLMLALAQAAYQAKQPQVAQTYLQKMVELPVQIQRDNNVAYMFLAQIAEEGKDLNKAKDWYAKVTDGDQYLSAVTRRAMIMGRTGQADEGLRLLKAVVVTSERDKNQLTSAQAQVLREAKRHDDAFQVLDEAVRRTQDTPEFLYEHALAAEKIGKLDVMEKSLRRLIELRPDAAHAYNALGYTFADRNMRLEEAQTLLLKASQLKPDDPHIVDSLGWLYYRMGQLDKAREYLEKALGMSVEPDVLVHLGEVLWSQGKKDEALKHWRDAQNKDPSNDTLIETLSRLKVKL